MISLALHSGAAGLRGRHRRQTATRRIELQLNVTWNTGQAGTSGANALKRFDTCDVSGHQVGQIELQAAALAARFQQLRDLGSA